MSNFVVVSVVVLFFGVFLYPLAETEQLSCSRSAALRVDCTVRSRWLGLELLQSHWRINDVRRVRVDETCDESCTRKIQVITGAGETALTFSTCANRSRISAAERINAFLDAPQLKSFDVELPSLDADCIPWQLIILPAAVYLKELFKKLFGARSRNSVTGDEGS